MLLLPVEKHSHAYRHTQVVPKSIPELKRFVSLLLLPCHNSRTQWSPGSIWFGVDTPGFKVQFCFLQTS